MLRAVKYVLSFIVWLASPFLAFIKRIRRDRLRRIMRGYRALKQSGHLDRIALVNQALTERKLGIQTRYFSKFILGAGVASGEIAVRQYLLIRIAGLNLNGALLLASGQEGGSVIFPLPGEWREVLTEQGFEVANFKSAVLWQFYIFAFLLYGILQIGRCVFSGIISGNGANPNQKPYVYFAQLASGNLPKNVGGSQSHDVISWYLQWHGRKLDIEAVHHGVANLLPVSVGNVSILPQNLLLPGISGWGSILSYAVWGVSSSAMAVLDCLRGRWWHAFLLNQAALAAQVRFLPVASLAKEYLFHNSGWIYRPLWTYEAERLGSTITFYFYSTNCEAFKKSGRYPAIPFGFKAINWPRYLVWDEYQADFVRRAVGTEAIICIVGSIWFQSSAAELPKFERRGVAVFDVTPHRASRYCQLGMDSEFYTPVVANPFLLEVSNAIQRHAVLMLWKRKRSIGSFAHPHYRRLADQLAKQEHVVLVDSDISPHRLIEASFAVVSMPFTSTAVIARELGKPSIYYDPGGGLQQDDRAAHGIPIISSQDELEAWLSRQLAVS